MRAKIFTIVMVATLVVAFGCNKEENDEEPCFFYTNESEFVGRLVENASCGEPFIAKDGFLTSIEGTWKLAFEYTSDTSDVTDVTCNFEEWVFTNEVVGLSNIQIGTVRVFVQGVLVAEHSYEMQLFDAGPLTLPGPPPYYAAIDENVLKFDYGLNYFVLAPCSNVFAIDCECDVDEMFMKGRIFYKTN